VREVFISKRRGGGQGSLLLIRKRNGLTESVLLLLEKTLSKTHEGESLLILLVGKGGALFRRGKTRTMFRGYTCLKKSRWPGCGSKNVLLVLQKRGTGAAAPLTTQKPKKRLQLERATVSGAKKSSFPSRKTGGAAPVAPERSLNNHKRKGGGWNLHLGGPGGKGRRALFAEMDLARGEKGWHEVFQRIEERALLRLSEAAPGREKKKKGSKTSLLFRCWHRKKEFLNACL